MKVKEFIDFIRPITALNPDLDLGIYEGSQDGDMIVINDKEVAIVFDSNGITGYSK